MENAFVVPDWVHLSMGTEGLNLPCSAAGCCKMSSHLGAVAVFPSVLLFGKFSIFQ